MIQREITDQENTTWTCVQAYSGGLNGDTEKTSKLAEDENGNVSVVCTPSGGAQSVRLELSKDWQDTLSDEDLNAQIKATQQEA